MTVARKLADKVVALSLAGRKTEALGVLMAANRPFRGKKESTPRAKQPPERQAASSDDEVWQEF
jgi:hypothetical protein